MLLQPLAPRICSQGIRWTSKNRDQHGRPSSPLELRANARVDWIDSRARDNLSFGSGPRPRCFLETAWLIHEEAVAARTPFVSPVETQPCAIRVPGIRR